MNDILIRITIIAGLLAAPLYFTLVITLGALEPGYSHLTMPMSILGGIPGPRGLLFNMGVASTGMLVIAFGLGLLQKLPPKTSAKIGCGLLVIGGLGLMGAAYFHCNQGCQNILVEPDLVGRLHIITSFLAGMGTGLAPLFFWASMRGSEQWRSFASPTLLMGLLANLPGITLWITLFTGYRLLSIEGLIQRLGFMFVLVWIFIAAMVLLRQESHEE